MNILVVRTDKLGDFITALPAIYVIKQHDMKNKIIVCVAPLNESLAKSCDFIDEVVLLENDDTALTLSKKLKKVHADVSITMFSNTKVAIAQALAKIQKRIAPATKIAQIFYTCRVKQKRSQVKMAEFEYNLALTKELFPEINLHYKKPLITFDDSKKIYENFCKENGVTKPVVAFHVGFGGSSDANWSTLEYEYLIRAVLQEEKYQVVLTFGPDEKELHHEMWMRLKEEEVVFYLSTEGIVNFAKLLSGFKLFVSTSTGTYHLASLVGCPTMTFFGDSLFASAARWKAVGDEKLQTHFMLPSEKDLRRKMLDEVKEKLLLL